MEEAAELRDYLPLSFTSPKEQEYVTFLWEAFEINYTPLHTAASLGDAGTMKALLQAGANLEARAEGGLTPLHWAALWGKAETIEVLLQVGADTKALTTAGKLPFYFIKDNAQLKKTDGYWKLYQARFE